MSRLITKRQIEVLRWTADGKRSEDTAELLGVTVKTVDAHVSRIMTVFGANTRAGMVAIALRKRIIK